MRVLQADVLGMCFGVRDALTILRTIDRPEEVTIHGELVHNEPHAEVCFIDTICHPTKEHQRALERLLGEVDAMVVVGGRSSNNTRELVALCRERNRPAFHVRGAADLDPSWFARCRTVGLTAGTSTLDETIEEVRQALLRIDRKGD